MYCSACGSKDQDGRYCSNCGSPQSNVALQSSANPPEVNDSIPREPLLIPPPSNTEYPGADFGPAAGIWNSWTSWQRTVWDKAGRPDLLTFAGVDFEEWIIDNADEDFDFDNFVNEVSSRISGNRSSKVEPKNRAAPWALGFGIASAFFFEFFFPMLVAIPLAIVGLNKATELKRTRADKTGFPQSLIGLVLVLVYLFVFVVVALGFGP